MELFVERASQLDAAIAVSASFRSPFPLPFAHKRLNV